MTDLEKDKLERFASDDVMTKAVAEELIASLPAFAYSKDMSNEQIGAMLRAHELAKEHIAKGLARIRSVHRPVLKRAGDNRNPGV